MLSIIGASLPVNAGTWGHLPAVRSGKGSTSYPVARACRPVGRLVCQAGSKASAQAFPVDWTSKYNSPHQRLLKETLIEKICCI